eukprot:GGOE01014532.1.p1 GENE.GGOE01014532.1~~GGOE01014532.1.p1  ORF type:complete len:674 (-),score=173.10 GGOE01014532.1:294-2315(-)
MAQMGCEAGATSDFGNTTHMSVPEDNTSTGLSADVANACGTQSENPAISIVIDCDASLAGAGGTELHSESDDGGQSPELSPKVPGIGCQVPVSWPEADLVPVHSPHHCRRLSTEGDTFSTASATDHSPIGPTGPRSWDTMAQHATAATETHNVGTFGSSALSLAEPVAAGERLPSNCLPADPANGRPTHSTTNLETLSETGSDVDTTDMDLQSIHSSVVSPGHRGNAVTSSMVIRLQEESLAASHDVCSSSTLSDTDTEVDSDLDPAEGECCESDPEEGGLRSPAAAGRLGRDSSHHLPSGASREPATDVSDGGGLTVEITGAPSTLTGDANHVAPTDGSRHCAKCNATMGSESWWPSMKLADCPKGGKHQWVSKSRAPSQGGLYYSVHASVKEGVMLHHMGRWRTYRVYLAGVCKAFGSAWNRWNPSYAAAQQIFGPNVMGKSVRGLIHAEYSSLFTEQVGCTSGRLQSGQDLLKLLNYGKRHGVPHLYSYVILADRLHFSETGQSMLKGVLSKHALLANAQREVRYSGEFHIQPFTVSSDPSVSHRLVIDNDSGTYAPVAELLPVVKGLLEANFPGLEVETLDREDPRLVKFKEEVRAMKNKPASLFSTCYDVECAHSPGDLPSQDAFSSPGGSLMLASHAITEDAQGTTLELAEAPDSPSLRSVVPPSAA